MKNPKPNGKGLGKGNNKSDFKKRTIDITQLRKVMMFRPTLPDVAGYFDCSKRLVQQFITENHGMTFLEYRDHCMAGVKLKLIQIAIDKGLEGDNEMLKYCLNNLAGWAYNPLPKSEDEDIEDMEF